MAQRMDVMVPDIGDFKDIPVIEISVRPGDVVKVDDTLLTLESDKATMDVPAPAAGRIVDVCVQVGDRVSEGMRVVVMDGEVVMNEAAPNAPRPREDAPSFLSATGVPFPSTPLPETGVGRAILPAAPDPVRVHIPSPAEIVLEMEGDHVLAHASPSVRAFARELGADLAQVAGSGPKGRILREDVQQHVRRVLMAPSAPTSPALGGGLDLLPWPQIDFAKFGPVETRPIPRIKRISGANLARNWAMIPHVTQFDEADITDLEAFRLQLNRENEKEGVKLTILAFLIKASVMALKTFPEFNASLDGQGEAARLVLKRYVHIGFAADTPNGLVVPVIRDADQKGLVEIAADMSALSKKARDGKLLPAEMQGGCFSISSLGGIGGTAFTPIINAPEVAILGVSKSGVKPQWDAVNQQFQPRLMLPLSLSYDHRVIDGAAAARFITHLGQLLADMRRALL